VIRCAAARWPISSQASSPRSAARSIHECAWRAFPVVLPYESRRRSRVGRSAPAYERSARPSNGPSAPWRCRRAGRESPVVARRYCLRRGRETGRRQQAGRLEIRPPFPIDVRRLAGGLSRRNLDRVSVGVQTFDKVVNPTKAQRFTNHVFVVGARHRLLGRGQLLAVRFDEAGVAVDRNAVGGNGRRRLEQDTVVVNSRRANRQRDADDDAAQLRAAPP